MQSQTLSVQQRTAKLLAALHELAATVDPAPRAQTILASALQACKSMDAGYRHACACATPAHFLSRISAVAVQAKRTKASLMLLAQLGYVTIEAAREPLFEARRLENIFIASRNTAKRRERKEPARRV